MTRNIIFLAACLFIATTLSSCDDCRGLFGKEKVECQNGGTCNEGTCDCLKGYYGEHCELKDFCELNDVVCVYGECTDGICYCDAGFEGEDCSVSSRAKFLGDYQITEQCDKLDTVTGHKLSIEEDVLNPARMHIYNLFNYNQFPINGFFSKISAVPTPNSNNFSIPEQQPDGDARAIRGSGSIVVLDSNTTKLHIEYVYKNKSAKEFNCTLDATLIQ